MNVTINTAKLKLSLIDAAAMSLIVVVANRNLHVSEAAGVALISFLSIAGGCLVLALLRLALASRRRDGLDGVRADVAPPGPSLRQSPALRQVFRD
jgi:hypothetical protein